MRNKSPGWQCALRIFLYCCPLTFSLPEENLEFYLMREQQTAQGQAKDENCSYAECSKLIVLWTLRSHICS